jgi:hypothetical protein
MPVITPCRRFDSGLGWIARSGKFPSVPSLAGKDGTQRTQRLYVLTVVKLVRHREHREEKNLRTIKARATRKRRNSTLTLSDSGRISTRVIVIQVVLLAVIAGVFALVKIYVPRMEKAQAAAQLAGRDNQIQDFFNSMVTEDSLRMVEAPGVGRTHPQSLKSTPSVSDVQQTLGAADTSTTDFAGGLHLTWIGAGHTLEASFSRGQLYCLSLKDNGTGHGRNVYKSSAQWQAF